MQISDNDSSILSSLVEFLATALGPAYEIVLYEQNDDGVNWTVRQAEMSFLFQAEPGDLMPSDLAALVGRSNMSVNSYITGLTAVINDSTICNLSLMFIRRSPPLKNCILAMYWDSTDYFDMAVRLFKISNLNEKIDIPGSAADAVKYVKSNSIIRITSTTPSQDSDKVEDNFGRVESVISKIDEVIIDIMGTQVHEQPAYTQDKKTEIVERLNSLGIFKIKGMIKIVSEKLYCSSATIYRYLSSM